jgi:hypothetical protein
MTHTIKITHTINGFILEMDGQQEVYEADEMDEYGEHKAFCRLCSTLAVEFGLGGTKHDAKRLRFELKDQEQ